MYLVEVLERSCLYHSLQQQYPSLLLPGPASTVTVVVAVVETGSEGGKIICARYFAKPGIDVPFDAVPFLVCLHECAHRHEVGTAVGVPVVT